MARRRIRAAAVLARQACFIRSARNVGRVQGAAPGVDLARPRWDGTDVMGLADQDDIRVPGSSGCLMSVVLFDGAVVLARTRLAVHISVVGRNA